MPVDSSRHYRGPGLGEAIWNCPACGAENQGAIAQGCALCGSGRPGYKMDAPPPPPPTATPEPPAAEETEFTRWMRQHPDATVEDAYTAGYIEGMRDARRQQLAAQPPAAAPPAEGDINSRTMIAALTFFRDQVLVDNPEEVTTGEWLNAAAVTNLIARLTAPRSHVA
jgi:hypothetical protein